MRIAVASGKGGTGKTTVSTGLALSLAGDNGAGRHDHSQSRSRLLFIDCDVEAPNAHLFLNPDFQVRIETGPSVPQVDGDACTYCGRCAEVCEFNAIAVVEEQVLTFPHLCHGCGSCALNCPEDAISEVPRAIGLLEAGPTPYGLYFTRGIMNVGEAMAVPIIRELKKWDVGPGREEDREGMDSDYWENVIIDVPPGTTCPVVEALQGVDFALLVAEPTPFGLHDLRLMVEVVSAMNIPAGVVLNRDGTGYEDLEQFCEDADLPVMLHIPLDRRIAEGLARREPLTTIYPEYQDRMREMYESIVKMVGRDLR